MATSLRSFVINAEYKDGPARQVDQFSTEKP